MVKKGGFEYGNQRKNYWNYSVGWMAKGVVESLSCIYSSLRTVEGQKNKQTIGVFTTPHLGRNVDEGITLSVCLCDVSCYASLQVLTLPPLNIPYLLQQLD